MDENDELQKILENAPQQPGHGNSKKARGVPFMENDPIEGNPLFGRDTRGLVQWTTADQKVFVPAASTAAVLAPGLYEVMQSTVLGVYFQKTAVKTEGLLRFPQTNNEQVVREIEKFWNKEEHFREYGLAYKRGIIMWGPPGSGKTSCMQLIMSDVISRDGVVVKFCHPALFLNGIRILREIQPQTPVVVLMEDIDAILEQYHSESEVLQILDGVDLIDRVAFLATTNYPERLGARILNRPSRFDKRFKIGHPNRESRRLYFTHLIGAKRVHELGIDLDKWVADTRGFSLAHLKELFIATVILGDDYQEAIKTLGGMKEKITSEDENDRLMGFLPGVLGNEDS